MIKHVVCFKMKPENAMKNACKLALRFQDISSKIPGCVTCETGINTNNEKDFYELGLSQTFESNEALQAYLAHPLHLAVREFVFEVIDHRIVVDFDL
ncbi:MAG: Dabb family protein [Eubacteriales bacterium]|nr:Dabb family protein [Eubacteriales bacterium]